MGNRVAATHPSSMAEEEELAALQIHQANTGFIPMTSMTVSEVCAFLDSTSLSEFKDSFRANSINGQRLYNLIRKRPESEAYNVKLNRKFEFMFRRMEHLCSSGIPKVLCRNRKSKYAEMVSKSVVREFITELFLAGSDKEKMESCGISLSEIAEIVPELAPKHLIRQGYRYRDFIAVGFTFPRENLRGIGFGVRDLMKNNFNFFQLVEIAYALKDFKGEGFTCEEIIRLGATKSNGFKARDLKRIHATIPEMRSAGYSPLDLINTGILFPDLLRGGYTAEEFRSDDFEAKILLEEGCGVSEMYFAGFTVEELREAGVTVSNLKAVGVSIRDIKEGGYTLQQIFEEYNTEDILSAGYSLRDMTRDGVRIHSLMEKNVTMKQLLSSSFFFTEVIDDTGLTYVLYQKCLTIEELRRNGVSLQEMIATKITIRQLMDGNVSVYELLDSGLIFSDITASVSLEYIYSKGHSVMEMIRRGIPLKQLYEGGVPIKLLLENGANTYSIVKAGISIRQVSAAVSADYILYVGVTIEQLLAQGVGAREIFDAGFTIDKFVKEKIPLRTLIEARFSFKELIRGGVSRANGYTLEELQELGFSFADLRKAGYAEEVDRLALELLHMHSQAGVIRDAEIMKKLSKIGNCPNYYEWRREEGGWRCSGGGHFVSDKESLLCFG